MTHSKMDPKMEILDTAGVFDENPEALHVERLQDRRGTLEERFGTCVCVCVCVCVHMYIYI